ncbi:MAG: prepilin-type N-terminal cleavage/methylation domain-containing protein [Neisseriaceae bacterium]|nr:MAG: prepilin-type N-terminal cleavage/methylation domain-containing protein [Neisseriaceae bacterium]
MYNYFMNITIMNPSSHFYFANQKGFTLLEFVVASALALLIMLSVGSLYVYTNRLNHIAQTNLKIQEDLRYASQLISRDASLAGNFGCLSLGSLYQKDSQNTDNKFNREFHIFFNGVDNSSPIVFDRPGSSAISNNQNFGVNVVPGKNLNINNFIPQGDALIFYYGLGSSGIKNINFGNNGNKIDKISFTDGDIYQSLQSVANQGGYLALSSCQALNIFKSSSGNQNLNFSSSDFGDVRISYQDEPNKQKVSEIRLLRYIVHAYVVGTANGQTGLYKIELNEDGIFGPPILISDYVASINTSFVYPTALDKNNHPIGCPSAFNDDIFSSSTENIDQKFNNYLFYEKNNTTFVNTTKPINPKRFQGVDLNQPLTDEYFFPPAGINVVLTINNPNLEKPTGLSQNNNQISNENVRINMIQGQNTTSNTFRIFSSIRGGNQCANRNLLD